jgi:hypothetical protein
MRAPLVLLGLLLGPGSVWAQACEQINLVATAQQRALLQDYVVDCYQRHFFFEDKGAVKLIAYQDAEGRPCWLLSAIVDDRYRAAPPAQYAHFGNNVILVYKGDSRGNALPPAGDSAERAACLSEVLGGRVYHYTNEPQYTIDKDAPGGPKKIKVTHESGGNVHNDLIIKFNKDGTVTKLVPV